MKETPNKIFSALITQEEYEALVDAVPGSSIIAMPEFVRPFFWPTVLKLEKPAYSLVWISQNIKWHSWQSPAGLRRKAK